MTTVASARTGTQLSAGWSEASDAGSAATEAVETALRGRTPAADDVVLVFAHIAYDAEKLIATATRLAAPAHVVGCSASAALAGGADGARPCVALHLPADDLAIGIGYGTGGEVDLHAAARSAAASAKASAAAPGPARPHEVLLVLSDGLAGDQRDVVRGAYEISGAAVPLIGGAAGEDLSMVRTWQAVDGEVLSGAVIAMWLASPDPIGVAIGHGWRPVSRQLHVTQAEGQVILELDGRPAYDAYLDARGELPRPDAMAFAGQVLDHPLGLPNPAGGYDVRHVMQRAGSGLHMFGHVHEQATVRLMAADLDDLLAATDDAARAARACLTRPSRGALVFSCAARLELLGDRAGEEAAVVADELDGATTGGLFTYGEFARVTGANGFHNASVGVLAL